jgi:hypothetical protein
MQRPALKNFLPSIFIPNKKFDLQFLDDMADDSGVTRAFLLMILAILLSVNAILFTINCEIDLIQNTRRTQEELSETSKS